MVWDYSIIKKYSSTSHYRLIKQLRSELKALETYKSKQNSYGSNSNYSSKTDV